MKTFLVIALFALLVCLSQQLRCKNHADCAVWALGCKDPNSFVCHDEDDDCECTVTTTQKCLLETDCTSCGLNQHGHCKDFLCLCALNENDH